ncbi:MAG: hypothetical protein HY698_08100 [Deltaproteobacteria bacterium]|nr:hypothetical protein [Deltaproteobacteria bacterium]
MKIRGFSVVTGAKHARYFEEHCLRSACQEENLRALRDVEFEWHVYTDAPRLRLPDTLHFVVKPAVEQTVALMEAVASCQERDQRLLMAPPDTFFGDGSLRSLIECAYGHDTSVAAPHVRVVATEFERRLPAGRVPNPELVSIAFDSLHGSWKDSFVGKNPSRSFFGGVVVKQINEKLYVVQHMLPTYFLARFLEEDVKFFERGQSQDWDWRWPEYTALDGRHRVICSSDAFFAVELTDPGSNLAELSPKRPVVDDFYESCVHNLVNRQMLCVFRRA